MYHIIGSDGREYGPVTAEKLREWIAHGRANAQTQVRVEGETAWRPLSDYPEFGVAAIPSAPVPGYAPVPTYNPAQMVSGPAIGLIATAVIGFFFQILSLLLNVAGLGIQAAQMDQVPAVWMTLFTGSMAIVFAILRALLGVVVLLGGIKMLKLQNHSLAMAASVIAAIPLPCVSPCCLIGLPIGIWAIVVLMKPEVKSAFR